MKLVEYQNVRTGQYTYSTILPDKRCIMFGARSYYSSIGDLLTAAASAIASCEYHIITNKKQAPYRVLHKINELSDLDKIYPEYFI